MDMSKKVSEEEAVEAKKILLEYLNLEQRYLGGLDEIERAKDDLILYFALKEHYL